MIYKIFYSCLFLISVASASDFFIAQNNKCKVFRTPHQTKLKVSWHGQCKNGYAEGFGIVRYIIGQRVDSVFYGRLSAGYWDSGAYDTKGGYLAGQFRNNELIISKNVDGVVDRNSIIHGFENASKAALQASEVFLKEGNTKSAKHYKAESEKLANQMD